MSESDVSILESFKEAPLWMLVCALLGLIGLGVGLRGLLLVKKNPKLAMSVGVAALVTGVAAIVTGFIGENRLNQHTFDATSAPGLSRADRDRIRAWGALVARKDVIVGVGAAVAPLLLGALAITLATAQRRALHQR
jgi:hypothetical protein